MSQRSLKPWQPGGSIRIVNAEGQELVESIIQAVSEMEDGDDWVVTLSLDGDIEEQP